MSPDNFFIKCEVTCFSRHSVHISQVMNLLNVHRLGSFTLLHTFFRFDKLTWWWWWRSLQVACVSVVVSVVTTVMSAARPMSGPKWTRCARADSEAVGSQYPDSTRVSHVPAISHPTYRSPTNASPVRSVNITERWLFHQMNISVLVCLS